MHLACEVVVQHLLSIFRSLVARELIEKYKFTQVEAAEKLGTTQAAISQYVHSKRGHRGIEQFEGILPLIEAAARETAKGIASGEMNTDEVASNFCRFCASLHEKGKIVR